MSAGRGSHRPTAREPRTFRPLSSSRSRHTGDTHERLGKGRVREACVQSLPGRCQGKPPSCSDAISQPSIKLVLRTPRWELWETGLNPEQQCDLPACAWGLAPNPSAVLLGHLAATSSLPDGVKQTWLPRAGGGNVSGGQLLPAMGISEPEEWKSEAVEPQVSPPWCLVLHQPHLQPLLSNYRRQSQPNLPASEWRNDCKLREPGDLKGHFYNISSLVSATLQGMPAGHSARSRRHETHPPFLPSPLE